jgi:hypothetical protein
MQQKEFLHNWILTRRAESIFGVLSLLTMILGLDIWLIKKIKCGWTIYW